MFGFRRQTSNQPLEQVKLLAVDMETTGLDPRRDTVLSIGWVPVNGRVIDLSGAGYVVVRGAGEVGESATIHGLTDDLVAQGIAPDEAVRQLTKALEDRVLLAHFAPIERDFFAALAGRPLRAPIVDTLEVERRHMERMGTYPRREDLRLARVRERYALPSYNNHNALSDAIACAELYLAQAAHTKGTTLAAMQPR